MNEQRRKGLRAIINKLEEARDTIESLKDEEQDAYDNLPEGVQSGERGDTMIEAIDNLDCAVSSIEDAINYVDDATA